MEKELFLRITDYCNKTGIAKLIEDSRAVTVGFSGGADSVFLLSFLKEFLPEEKLLCAVHLNHMLRGAEADRDEEFCRRFCEAENILFTSEKADVYSISEMEKQGIEECARNERYKLFDKCRKELAKTYSVSEERILTATAHNADDNMETVIFNMARGSGAAGLCGIPPVRDGVYIRPLLCLSSDEIRKYLGEKGMEFMLDSTNAENEYTRNKIRHNVVPVLKEINPSAHKAIRRLSEAVRSDEEYFQSEVSALLGADRKAGTAPLSKIRKAPVPILTRVLIRLYSEAAPEGSLSAVHLADILDMINRKTAGELHLPSAVTVQIDDSISFFKDSHKIREKTSPFCENLTEGVNCFNALGFVLGIRGMVYSGEKEQSIQPDSKFCDNVYNSLINVSLNNDKIKGAVFVRNRRESDVYLTGGHHKKLKKLFCDKKIPRDMRDKLPLVCDDEGILWIPGFPPRDGVAFKGEGKKLSIYYYSSEKEHL